MRHHDGLRVILLLAALPLATAHGQANPPPRRPAAARPAADPAAEAAKRQEMEQILATWETKSKRLTSLDVTLTRVDISPAWGEKTEFRGHAYLQKPDFARLEFQKLDAEKKPPLLVDHERIICTGSYVLQYTYPTKQIFVFPIAKDTTKRALEQGPLPFLFNMQAQVAKQRYRMALANENRDVYLIGVDPIVKTDLEAFSKAYVWLDKKTFLPRKLLLISPNGKDKKDYTFTAIEENQNIDPKLFQGERLAGWTVVQENALGRPNPAPNAPAQAVDPARNAARVRDRR